MEISAFYKNPISSPNDIKTPFSTSKAVGGTSDSVTFIISKKEGLSSKNIGIKEGR